MDRKQTKVKVVVRVRPKLSPETKECVEADHNSVEIFNHRNIHENIKYEFCSVFNKTSSQMDVFNGSVLPILSYPLEGHNVSIFAYGPTGAGKTHTMQGSPCNPGIIPRVVTHLFASIREEELRNPDRPPRQQWTHTVTMSYLEIYNEKVQDLLERSKTDLPIREDSSHNIFVAGLAEKEIKSFDDFKMLFAPASNNRTVAFTKLNDHSSRSHSILLLKVRRRQVAPPCVEYQGKIYLIDLAGSEDNRRTGNKGIRLKESGAINKSLFALGEVVDAINNNLPRIPYRNSKLTRLLQDSIGGSCHSLMITNIAPEEGFYYDTYCTLNFASKSKKIVNTNTVNVKETAAQQVTPLVAMAMKRPASSDAELVLHKRQKISPATSASAPPSSDLAPLLSPLLKRQTTLERTVNNRLEEMEQNILQQIRHLTSQNSHSSSLASLQQQLHSFSSQLSQMQQLNKAQPRSALNDKTNIANKEKRPMMKQRSKGDLPSKATAKPKEGPASIPSEKGGDSLSKPPSKKPLDPEMQRKHNAEFLLLLNRASVKELQELHTVGNKRARLIWEWRELHGSFASFDDLQNIPGFTTKYIGKLLQSNWVELSMSS